MKSDEIEIFEEKKPFNANMYVNFNLIALKIIITP